MKRERKLNLALVASGSGTDAEAIMKAWSAGQIPAVESLILISTKPGEGCIDKAKNCKINHFVIDQKQGVDAFNAELFRLLINKHIDLVFLVGCIALVKPPVSSKFNRLPAAYTKSCGRIKLYNIHPADPEDHGGKKMYGLAVHEHVLSEIADKIKRGMVKEDDRFFTYPTVHEAVAKYDQGASILTGSVEIPRYIIIDLMNGTMSLQEAADALRKTVLPYEWMMLPAAVNMAAYKILHVRRKVK